MSDTQPITKFDEFWHADKHIKAGAALLVLIYMHSNSKWQEVARCSTCCVIRTRPSKGMHPLIQDVADMTPFETYPSRVSFGLCHQGELVSWETVGSPIGILQLDLLVRIVLFAGGGGLPLRPCAPGGKAPHPRRQSASERGAGCWGTGWAAHLELLQLRLLACMQEDRLEH